MRDTVSYVRDIKHIVTWLLVNGLAMTVILLPIATLLETNPISNAANPQMPGNERSSVLYGIIYSLLACLSADEFVKDDDLCAADFLSIG